jgi:hypothetical protein
MRITLPSGILMRPAPWTCMAYMAMGSSTQASTGASIWPLRWMSARV